MRDRQVGGAYADMRANHDCADGCSCGRLRAWAFIEGHNQQAVVGHRPPGIAVHAGLQPLISVRHRTVVQIVTQVRDDEGDGEQRGEISGREIRERPVHGVQYDHETGPRGVLAYITPRTLTAKAGAGEIFAITHRRKPSSGKRGGKVGRSQNVAPVVPYAMRRAAEQRDVVGLAGGWVAAKEREKDKPREAKDER